MGERGQIRVVEEKTEREFDDEFDHDVYLYTHWNGPELEDIVFKALSVRERWDDPEYLTRIIFCEMLKFSSNPLNESESFGIGNNKHGDLNYPLITINCTKQTVEIEDKEACLFEDFLGDYAVKKKDK